MKPSGVSVTGPLIERQTVMIAKRRYRASFASASGSRSRTRCGPDFPV